MNKAYQLLSCLSVAFVVFWLVRVAGWVNSLTTVRTDFYWSLNHFAAWAMAAVVCVVAYFLLEDK